MKFYLGTHVVSWAGRTDFPLFLSRRRLTGRRTYPRALAPWALDSGGFSELSLHGTWGNVPPGLYIEEVRRFSEEMGNLEWAAIQDWMCEPQITAKTMPTMPHAEAVRWHQALTIHSYKGLADLAPEIPWAPVLQGWEIRDYHRHLEMYDKAGVDLRKFPVVGVGSVCRREGTREAEEIMRGLAAYGLKLHGFGVKISGLKRYSDCLVSADSMAWSFGARYSPPLEGCTHKNCANCIKYAVMWREQLLKEIEG